MAVRPSIADSSAQQKAVLGALTKKDPNITRVVDTAAHVALYEFDEVKQVWARGKVEGALHVVERSVDPRYQLVVVNRLSPENRVEDITPELQIQDQDPYLFYKNRKGETHGIWFYNGQDRERIVSFIEGLEEKDMSVPKVEEPSSNAISDGEGDIMRFFARASTAALAKPPAAVSTSHLPPPSAAPGGTIPAPFMLPPAPHAPHSAVVAPSAHMSLPPAPHLYQPRMDNPFPYMTIGTPPPSAHVPPPTAVHPPAHYLPPQPARPAIAPSPAKPQVTRAQIKEALLRLAQDDEFIDLVYSKYIQAP